VHASASLYASAAGDFRHLEDALSARVTDKPLLRRRMARAQRLARPGADFLLAAVIRELGERLSAIDRTFPVAVAFGGRSEALAGALSASGRVGGVLRLEEIAEAFAPDAGGAVADEETLPIAPAAVDLYVSALTLQWANDLPGALVQIRRALKPKGLFLAALTGVRSLQELREAMFEAEMELSGGASPRVLPGADLAGLGGLMQRAGFVQPVADRDLLTARYDSALALAADLKAMGASNALLERDRRPTSRGLLARMAEIYADRFGDADGRVRATFEIVTLSGWAPGRNGRTSESG
jgi:SAM-dependent methyltransferase